MSLEIREERDRDESKKVSKDDRFGIYDGKKRIRGGLTEEKAGRVLSELNTKNSTAEE